MTKVRSEQAVYSVVQWQARVRERDMPPLGPAKMPQRACDTLIFCTGGEGQIIVGLCRPKMQSRIICAGYASVYAQRAPRGSEG